MWEAQDAVDNTDLLAMRAESRRCYGHDLGTHLQHNRQVANGTPRVLDATGLK